MGTESRDEERITKFYEIMSEEKKLNLDNKG